MCIVRFVANARIREAREAARMSQAQLGRAVGVAPMTISRWERGASKPHPVFLERVAVVTGKPVGFFA